MSASINLRVLWTKSVGQLTLFDRYVHYSLLVQRGSSVDSSSDTSISLPESDLQIESSISQLAGRSGISSPAGSPARLPVQRLSEIPPSPVMPDTRSRGKWVSTSSLHRFLLFPPPRFTLPLYNCLLYVPSISIHKLSLINCRLLFLDNYRARKWNSHTGLHRSTQV